MSIHDPTAVFRTLGNDLGVVGKWRVNFSIDFCIHAIVIYQRNTLFRSKAGQMVVSDSLNKNDQERWNGIKLYLRRFLKLPPAFKVVKMDLADSKMVNLIYLLNFISYRAWHFAITCYFSEFWIYWYLRKEMSFPGKKFFPNFSFSVYNSNKKWSQIDINLVFLPY